MEDDDGGEKEEDEVKGGTMKGKSSLSSNLMFGEFQMFLQALCQYYIYCQVFKNDQVDEEMVVRRERFTEPHTVRELQVWVGEGLDMDQEFREIDADQDGRVLFWEVVEWAFKKNMDIELGKLEEEDNSDDENTKEDCDSNEDEVKSSEEKENTKNEE